MAAKKGQAVPQFTAEQKADIVKKFCELYASQQATFESCCNALGVSVRAMRYWIEADAQLAELYKKAKERQSEIAWEEIREKAVSGLMLLVSGTKYTEIKREEGVGPQGEINKTTETEVTVLPNPTSVIFALKGEFPDRFADRQKVDTSVTVEQARALDVEKIEEMRNRIRANGDTDKADPLPGKSKR